jgi:acyl-CoA thioesterase-1
MQTNFTSFTNRRHFLVSGMAGLLGVIGAADASAQQETAAAGQAAPRPKNPAMAEVPDVPGLPRVLLIGDSISMGYTVPVREKLAGRANVHRPLENCADSGHGIARMDAWLGAGPWDVIHFNFGLHDMKYLDAQGKYVPPDQGKQVATPEVYAENLRRIVLRLKKTGAGLIFATTTPVPSGSMGRVENDDRIYNKAALRVMKATGVVVNDIGGYVQRLQAKLPPVPPRVEGNRASLRPGDIQLPNNVHFTDDGSRQLADLVAAQILKLLPSRKP